MLSTNVLEIQIHAMVDGGGLAGIKIYAEQALEGVLGI
jgi:hypothetical protein